MIFTFAHLEKSVEIMSKNIRKQDFLTYFKRFSLMVGTETNVTIGVISSFHQDNLSKKFYTEIKTAIVSIVPTIEAIDFVVDDTIEMRAIDEVIDCRDAQRVSEKKTKNESVHGVEIVE
jgi:chromosomal replication initiation ATPase DnaA